MKRHFIALVAACLVFPAVLAAQALNTSMIDQVLGHSGQKTGDVYV